MATWVQNAEAGKNNLQVVSADQARPGDLVAYDWSGGNDFGSNGHIGFLASSVQNGQFTALEGNEADAVNQVIALARRTHAAGNKLIFVGNGGSSAIASHMATDYSKNGDVRAMALNDTAIASHTRGHSTPRSAK